MFSRQSYDCSSLHAKKEKTTKRICSVYAISAKKKKKNLWGMRKNVNLNNEKGWVKYILVLCMLIYTILYNILHLNAIIRFSVCVSVILCAFILYLFVINYFRFMLFLIFHFYSFSHFSTSAVTEFHFSSHNVHLKFLFNISDNLI